MHFKTQILLGSRPWIDRLLRLPVDSLEFVTAVQDRFCDLLNAQLAPLKFKKNSEKKIVAWKVTAVCQRMNKFAPRILTGEKFILFHLQVISLRGS